jgi:glutaconate CoA-transferase subunit A
MNGSTDPGTGLSGNGEQTSPWRNSLSELISVIAPGDRLGVSGFHFTRAPIALLEGLLKSDKRPLHYVSWGGGFPLEILLTGDQVSEASICFSSLEVFGLAPRFRAAVESGRIRFHERTALTYLTELRAAAEHLDYAVTQSPEGSDLLASLTPVESATVPMVKVPGVPLDVFLLHAQRADDDGNVEIQGARGLDLSSIFAAKKVLVTVEERVRPGGLGAARSFILPRSHVTLLTTSPQGAYPTACLPYYTADLKIIADAVEAGTDAALLTALHPTAKAIESGRAGAAISTMPRSQVRDELLSGIATHLASEQPDADPGSEQTFTIPELMIALISDSVTNDSICSFGSASLVPAAAYLLAKAGHAPKALLMSSNGGYVDLAPRPMMLTLAEAADFATATAHMGGDETYRWYYQPGRVTHVDQHGATNNLWITRGDGSRIRLPGQGGMGDVANLHRDFVIYLPRQNARNLVASLDAVSASRAWLDDRTRRSYGLMPGSVRVITDLAVFVLDHTSKKLRVETLHPNVTPDELRSAMDFEPGGLDEATTTPAPTRATLRRIRKEVDPLGTVRLEFLPARDRSRPIHDILAAEDAIAQTIKAKVAGQRRKKIE